jgi:hypothetical protein
VSNLRLNEPLAHQLPIDESDARWKVWRGGRRSGKTEWAAKAATDGHGPRDWRNVPRFKGLLQGLDVAWVVRDYTQSEIFWHEFIEPTFRPLVRSRLNASDRVVDLGTGGRLWVKSAENIASIRGLGKNLGGVIFEEAGYYDTLEIFRREIRPMLMDNKGWGAWISSTKAGSEFNSLCQDVMEGKRSPDDGWAHFHTTPYDNPLLDPAEIGALIAEYGPGQEDVVAEEVFAELLEGGGGLAFPEWRTDLHCLSIPIPELKSWRCSAGLDWGYDEPGALEMFFGGPGGRLHLAGEVRFQKELPNVVARRMADLFIELQCYPEFIAYDSAIDAGMSGQAGISHELQTALNQCLPGVRVPMVSVDKSPGSRALRKLRLHHKLAWKADNLGIVHAWGRPLLTVDPVRCPYFVRTVPKLKKPSAEDLQNVDNRNRANDISQRPKQDDHGYDAGTYLLLAIEPHSKPEPTVIPANQHPGFIEGTWERKSRVRDEATELRELQRTMDAMGATHGRYRRPA